MPPFPRESPALCAGGHSPAYAEPTTSYRQAGDGREPACRYGYSRRPPALCARGIRAYAEPTAGSVV